MSSFRASVRLYSFAECRRLDAGSIAAGLPEQQLMGQAALASYYALRDLPAFRTARRVLVLCGPGNNGGDGYALAALLGSDQQRDRSLPTPIVYASAAPKSTAAQFYAAQAQTAGVELCDADAFVSESLRADDLIVEALLGIGQREAPRGAIGRMLEHLLAARINDSAREPRPCTVSLDVPAGLCENESGDSANPELAPFCPDEIHSYGVDKLALRLDRRLAAHSRVRVLPMGFAPQELQATPATSAQPRRLVIAEDTGSQADGASAKRFVHEREQLRATFNKSPLDHKHSAGHGRLIGGSRGMNGALLMAAQAFFASGGGILHVLSPDAETMREMRARIPGAMFLDPASKLPTTLRPAAVCVGPGLAPADLEGIARWLLPLFTNLDERYTNRALPRVILDAGALPLVRTNPGDPAPDLLDALPREQLLLTPHTGEWQRLGGPAIHCTEDFARAREHAAQELRAACLVKDAVCAYLPASDSQAPGVRDRPNAGLAVAGSGDNLCGILLACAARRRANASETVDFWFEASTAALSLLDLSASSSHHLRADQFADCVRALLQADAESTPESTS